MSMTDPIADMLTRIRNAVAVKKQTVDIPFSKVKEAILAVLKREGFIEDFKVGEASGFGMIRVWLKYARLGKSVIQEIHRASRPGLRLYRGSGELEPVLHGIGIAVVSTSKGILSDRECRKEKVGGEVLCTIW